MSVGEAQEARVAAGGAIGGMASAGVADLLCAGVKDSCGATARGAGRNMRMSRAANPAGR